MVHGSKIASAWQKSNTNLQRHGLPKLEEQIITLTGRTEEFGQENIGEDDKENDNDEDGVRGARGDIRSIGGIDGGSGTGSNYDKAIFQYLTEYSAIERAATVILRTMSPNHKMLMSLTTRGFIGNFPTKVEKGDLVGILKGCSWPVVLRKLDGFYIHIGHCLIPGLMDGEATEFLKSREAQIETIEIR